MPHDMPALLATLVATVGVGRTAVVVALAGVAPPFALGYGVAVALGVARIAAVVSGAALTATSIGIPARVLSDLGRLETPEGRVVLGATVLDDIVGLVIRRSTDEPGDRGVDDLVAGTSRTATRS